MIINLFTYKHYRSFAMIVILFAAMCASCASPYARMNQDQFRYDAYADIVIVGGRIWTGNESTNLTTVPTALATRAGRIIAVGTDLQIRAYVGPYTKIIDARARRIIPGITDSHTHMISGGLQLGRLMLRNVQNKAEFIQEIADKAKLKREGEWILGGRWSVESWDQPENPTREWIDSVTINNPVFLSRMDGHSALVNSTALKLAGIDRDKPADPKGGEIVRDPKTGEPTGYLRESAMGLVSRFIPAPAPKQQYEAFQCAMKHASSLGITSVHDMCGLSHLDLFRRAQKEGTLSLRITAYLQVGDWTNYVDQVEGYNLNNDMIRVAGFKGYMDGSMGSRTAYMREPFSDATPDMPYPYGQLSEMADPIEKFQQQIALADGLGLQIAVHAIGDEANHQLLNAYEYTQRHHGRRNARHRDEHAQHLLESDIKRFARLGVVASMQPFHKADDGRYAEIAIGSQRLSGSYAYRKLIDSGALLIFGSDWPVVTMNPFRGIDAAVNARTLAGDIWLPSHSLTLEEAIHAYTVAPPEAIHRDDRLGTIEVGKFADLVILQNDLFTIPADRLGDIKVAMTIFNGNVVYNAFP